METPDARSTCYKFFGTMHPRGWGGNVVKWGFLATLIGCGSYGGLRLLNKFSHLKGLNQLTSQQQLLAASLITGLPILLLERVTGIWVRKQELRLAQRPRTGGFGAAESTSSTGESSQRDPQVTIDDLRRQLDTARAWGKAEEDDDRKETIERLEGRIAELTAQVADSEQLKPQISRFQEELSEKEIALVQLQEKHRLAVAGLRERLRRAENRDCGHGELEADLQTMTRRVADLTRQLKEARSRRQSSETESSQALRDRSRAASQEAQKAIEDLTTLLEEESSSSSEKSDAENSKSYQRLPHNRPPGFGNLLAQIKNNKEENTPPNRPRSAAEELKELVQEIREGGDDTVLSQSEEESDEEIKVTCVEPAKRLNTSPLNKSFYGAPVDLKELEQDTSKLEELAHEIRKGVDTTRRLKDGADEEVEVTAAQLARGLKTPPLTNSLDGAPQELTASLKAWEEQYGEDAADPLEGRTKLRPQDKVEAVRTPTTEGQAVGAGTLVAPVTAAMDAGTVGWEFDILKMVSGADRDHDPYAFNVPKPGKEISGEPWKRDARLTAWNEMQGNYKKFHNLIQRAHTKVQEKMLATDLKDSFLEAGDFEACIVETAEELKIELRSGTQGKRGDKESIKLLMTFLKRPEEIYSAYEQRAKREHEANQQPKDRRHIKIATERRRRSRVALKQAKETKFSERQARELAELEAKETLKETLTVAEKQKLLRLRQRKDQSSK